MLVTNMRHLTLFILCTITVLSESIKTPDDYDPDITLNPDSDRNDHVLKNKKPKSSTNGKLKKTKKTIAFVTSNEKKLKEVTQLFNIFYNGSVPFNLYNKHIDLPEHQGETDVICTLKARAAFEIIKGPCIVEDTSLCINAIGGLPGPYVKWFLVAIGSAGIYRMVKEYKDKTTYGVCTVAYVNEKGEVSIFSDKIKGTLVQPTDTINGWDSCFKPDGSNVTYSQMSIEEKNRISERMKSIYKLKQYLDKHVLNN